MTEYPKYAIFNIVKGALRIVSVKLNIIRFYQGDLFYIGRFLLLKNCMKITQGTVLCVPNTTRGLLDYSVYGNNQKIEYTYDMLDRVTEKKYNDTVKVTYK